MIHYTLLPDKEIRTLKKEYRFRLFVVAMFFISAGILIGIFSLIPSYIHSYEDEKEKLILLENMKKDRESRGLDIVSKDLDEIDETLAKFANLKNSGPYSDLIASLVGNKPKNVSITSIRIDSALTASSTPKMIIQGKSDTREDLIKFKENIDTNINFSKAELPVSDLAKSTDILYSIRVEIKEKK